MNADCLSCIFNYLQLSDLKTCFSVCKQYNVTCKRDCYWETFMTKLLDQKQHAILCPRAKKIYVKEQPYANSYTKYKTFYTLYEFSKNHNLSVAHPYPDFICLELFNQNIKTIPCGIGLLNISYLGLRKNQIQTLPSQLFTLKLATLDLSFNQIEYLSPEIGLMTRLVQLILNDNKLKSIPSNIGKLTRLTKLAIDRNPLKSLPIELNLLTRLSDFKISEVNLHLFSDY